MLARISMCWRLRSSSFGCTFFVFDGSAAGPRCSCCSGGCAAAAATGAGADNRSARYSTGHTWHGLLNINTLGEIGRQQRLPQPLPRFLPPRLGDPLLAPIPHPQPQPPRPSNVRTTEHSSAVVQAVRGSGLAWVALRSSINGFSSRRSNSAHWRSDGIARTHRRTNGV